MDIGKGTKSRQESVASPPEDIEQLMTAADDNSKRRGSNDSTPDKHKQVLPGIDMWVVVLGTETRQSWKKTNLKYL